MTMHIGKRPLAVTAFCAAILALTITSNGTAAAAGLFDPASSAEMRTSLPTVSSEGAIRDRLVRLNTDELASIVPLGVDNAGNRLDRAKNLKGTVTLDLFPGVSVTAQRKDIEAPEEGGYVWVGEANGTQPSFVTLSIVNNEVVGQIQSRGKLYSIEPVSGRLHRIIEVNQDDILDDIHLDIPPDLLNKGQSTGSPDGENGPTPRAATIINVMVANTINARNECRTGTAAQRQQCIQQRISVGLSLANQAFIRSGVAIKFVRVGGANEINYNEAALYGGLNSGPNYTGVICDLTGFNCASIGVANNKTALFTALRAKRTTFKADLVVLMRKAGAACGIAWTPDPPVAGANGTHAYGYSVVTSTKGSVYNCIEGNTFAHETGHNMGLQHDRIQYRIDNRPSATTLGPMPPPTKFNFGHVNRTAKFFTIMSYRSSCGNGCERIPNFSNPAKLYKGVKTGVAPPAAGAFGAANAASTLNTMRSRISTYR